MVDQGVINIIEEIRERVRAGSDLQANAVDSSTAVSDKASPPTPVMTNSFAGLAVLERAWERLPPIVSNRTGNSARLELWIKTRFKRLLRWFTWEQVNFNAATHQTFRDIVETLTSYEQYLHSQQAQLDRQQSELNSQGGAIRAEFETFRRSERQLIQQYETQKARQNELERLIQQLQMRIQQLVEQQQLQHQLLQQCEQQLPEQMSQQFEQQLQRQQVAFNLQLNNQRSDVEGRFTEIRNQIDAIQTDRTQLESSLTRLSDELARQVREGDERVLDEQRVCFKQLSLEANETFVLLDRARRQLASRLEKFENKD